MPETFHSFGRLPAELRIQIWSLAIPCGVYIHLYRRPTQEHHSQHLIARCSNHRVPPLLHTNSEARFVALPYFQLLGTGHSRCYFNPFLDTLMLGLIYRTNCETLSRYPNTILGSNVKMIKHIAVYALPFFPGWFGGRMPSSYPALESFAMLDLSQWEAGTRRGGPGYPGARGRVDYEALRDALNVDLLRAERLKRVETEEVRRLERPMQEFVRLASQVEAAWTRLLENGTRESVLSVMIMRLPFPGKEEWEGLRGIVKGKDVTQGHLAIGADGGGSPRKSWRSLRKLFSKLTL